MDSNFCSRKIRRKFLFGAYLAIMTCVLVLLALGLDCLTGRLLPVSPWPPLGMRNYASVDDAVQQYDFECIYHMNRHGLRGPEPPPKSREKFRILAIGDSYVYGWGVNEAETWVKQLEGLLRGAGRSVEIINGGAPGNSPVEYAQRAEYLIPEFQPDLVLVCILQGGDIGETPTELRWFPNLSMLIRNWKYRERPPQSSERFFISAEYTRQGNEEMARKIYAEFLPAQRLRFDALDEVVKQSFLEGRLNTGMVEGIMSMPDWYSGMTDARVVRGSVKSKVIAAMLVRIRRISALYSGRVFSVLMPEGPFVNHAAITNWSRLGYEMPSNLYGSELLEGIVQRASDKAGIRLLNLAPAFRQHADDAGLFFVLDTHMTAAGHRLVAERLFEILQQEIPSP